MSRNILKFLIVFGFGLAGAELNAASAQEPKAHYRVERPAELSGDRAQEIYDRILADMVNGYRLSGAPVASEFPRWQRFNTKPYRSDTHGERFVNNYGNGAAAAYGDFEAAGTMPVGAILAKDSFAVTKDGDVFTGPLFLMEKMPAGFDAEARDWRYSMVMPDGSLYGISGGSGADRVAFCATCHETAGDDQDHLFFLPAELRVE